MGKAVNDTKNDANGPATAAPFFYAQLVWVMLFGMFFFGEMPDALSLTGILVIVGSGLFVALLR